MRPSRATRGIVLLVGLLGTVVFGALAAFGVLVLWAPVVPLVMAAAGFAWLRAGVRSEVRARHEARSAARERVRPASSRSEFAPAAPTRPRSPARQHDIAGEAPSVESAGGTEVERHEVAEATRAAEAPFDVAAPTSTPAPADAQPVAEPVVEQPAAVLEVALPEVDEDDIPLTWDPRPVPTPDLHDEGQGARSSRTGHAGGGGRRGRADGIRGELPQRRISGL